MTNATDAARALATEHNIDLAFVNGSGKDGKIVIEDVRVHIAGQMFNDDLPPVDDDPQSTDEINATNVTHTGVMFSLVLHDLELQAHDFAVSKMVAGIASTMQFWKELTKLNMEKRENSMPTYQSGVDRNADGEPVTNDREREFNERDERQVEEFAAIIKDCERIYKMTDTSGRPMLKPDSEVRLRILAGDRARNQMAAKAAMASRDFIRDQRRARAAALDS